MFMTFTENRTSTRCHSRLSISTPLG